MPFISPAERGQAAFSDLGPRRVEGDHAVYPNSVIFVAGDYPAHKFAMTPEELESAVTAFSSPVPGNIEHTDFLAGKACEVRSVRLDDADPSVMRGEVAVPLWLDAELGAHERGLSAEFDRETKRLSGVCLTVTPAIPRAALMSAHAKFAAKHRTYEGQMVIQDIHDMTSRHGAVCTPSKKAGFHSKSESSAIQKIHDMSTEHGASCRVMTGKKSMYTAPTKESKVKVNFKSILSSWFGAGQPEEFEITPEGDLQDPPVVPPKSGTVDFTKTPDFQAAVKAAVEQATAGIRKQSEDDAVNQIARDAAAFADAEVQAGRSHAHERGDLVVAFTQAALDDRKAGGTVKFSVRKQDGTAEQKEGTRVEALRAREGARKPHGLTHEWLPADQLPASFRQVPAGAADDPYAADEASARKFAEARNGKK